MVEYWRRIKWLCYCLHERIRMSEGRRHFQRDSDRFLAAFLPESMKRGTQSTSAQTERRSDSDSWKDSSIQLKKFFQFAMSPFLHSVRTLRERKRWSLPASWPIITCIMETSPPPSSQMSFPSCYGIDHRFFLTARTTGLKNVESTQGGIWTNFSCGKRIGNHSQVPAAAAGFLWHLSLTVHCALLENLSFDWGRFRRSPCSEVEMNRTKVIIDCDPGSDVLHFRPLCLTCAGIDDSMALFFALSQPSLEIVRIIFFFSWTDPFFCFFFFLFTHPTFSSS